MIKLSIGIEIILYLLILIGVLTISITFFNEDKLIKDSYIERSDNTKNAELVLYIQGIENKEVKKLKRKIEKGQFNNIYEIVDKYSVICEKD